MDPADLMTHLSGVFNAQYLAESGHYCQCDEPARSGTICAHCGRCIREVEIERVRRIVQAHEFAPHDGHPEMCDVCSNWRDHRRHNGFSDTGRLRDGTTVFPDD